MSTQQTETERRLWDSIKRTLLSEEGDQYFRDSVKDCLLPQLYGTVVSVAPTENPTTIVLALSNTTDSEVTLELAKEGQRTLVRTAFPGRMKPGDGVEFMGIAITFSKDPFMLTFDAPVERLKHIPQ